MNCKMRHTLHRLITSGMILSMSGCTVGPNFVRPHINAPANWWTAPGGKTASQTTDAPIDPQWWKAFGDPELTSLESRVAGANLDVQIASTRLLQSRAQRQIAGAEQFPSLDAGASYQRDRASPAGVLALTGTSPTGSTLSADPNSFGVAALPGSEGSPPFDLWQYSLSASWEIDLWGRIRRGVEAANASQQAADEGRRAVVLTVLSEMAEDYIQLRATQALVAIVHQNIDLANRTLALVQLRYADGATTILDVANAKAQVATIEARLPALQTQQTSLIDAMSLLLAEPPRALASELDTPQAIPPVPPEVPVGLPSELARRRPDIGQAEAELHAATANIGVAVASFYPDITLNGSGGTQSLQFPTSWNLASNQYSVGPSISLPIFEGGELRGMLHLRRAQQREAALNYQRTVLQAWDDVDNALTAYNEEQRHHELLTEAVAQNQIALASAQRNYGDGAVDFLNVLTVQFALIETQSELTQSTAAIDEALVGLYKALGGGWESTFPELATR
jgi:NodT family efflux transporter outer membrane factor (OMF) lipoprotein